MKKGLLFLFLLPLLFSGQNSSSGPSRTIDSLKSILKTTKQDTNCVNALSELSQILAGNNPDTALILGNQAIALAQKLNYKIGEAWAELRIGRAYSIKQNHKDAISHYNKALQLSEILLSSNNKMDVNSAKKLKGRTLSNIANIYNAKSDFPKALEYYFKGLKIAEEVVDKQQVGKTLGNIATVYQVQADYPKALEYYLKGLKTKEEIGDKKGVGKNLSDIGSIYLKQMDYDKALKYFLKGLKQLEEAGDKQMIGMTFNYIGIMYYELADYPKALEYFFKSIKIKEATGDKQGLGNAHINVGLVYRHKADYDKALKYYFEALKIADELDDIQMRGNSIGNIGALYITLKKHKEAEIYLKKALTISIEIGAEDLVTYNHITLSNLYEKTNRPALALAHYKKHIALRDTIFSKENSKKLMRSEMNFEFEKQKAVADAKHKSDLEKQTAVAAEKARKQKVIMLSVSSCLLIVIGFSFFVFRSLRITRKQKQLIDLKNAETEKQKHLIEEKQLEILDSIRYAKRIQMALITSEYYISKNLNQLIKKD